MRIIKGKVTETLIVVKEVEFKIPDMEGEDDEEDIEDIDQMVRDKAYEKTILESWEEHGWEPVKTVDVDVEWTSKTKGEKDDPVEPS